MIFLHANSYYSKTMPSQHQDYITKFSGLREFGLPVMEQGDHQGLKDIFLVWYVRQSILLVHNIGMKEEDLTIPSIWRNCLTRLLCVCLLGKFQVCVYVHILYTFTFYFIISADTCYKQFLISATQFTCHPLPLLLFRTALKNSRVDTAI